MLDVRLKFINDLIAEIDMILSKLPEGKLKRYITKDNRVRYYVQFEDKKGTYISVKDTGLIRKYVLREYYEAQKSDLLKEKEIIEFYRKSMENVGCDTTIVMSESWKREYCPKMLLPHDKVVYDWEREEYQQLHYKDEEKKTKTLRGEMVRSKSEGMIVNELFRWNIPYRYECILETKLGDIYPDITIMNPVTHGIVLWEHFGRMGDPVYRQKAKEKINMYLELGYIPDVDILFSFETRDDSVSINKICTNIYDHFLVNKIRRGSVYEGFCL